MHQITATRFSRIVSILAILCGVIQSSHGRITTGGSAPYARNTKVTDFRYSSAQIDGITRLLNGTWLVISNGHYWMLRNREMPTKFNVRGRTSELYGGLRRIDSVWLDPYNDLTPQTYLVENSPTRGLRVVCQEFERPYSSESQFCHLPVSDGWRNALKDLDPKKPVDAVTWRNRTRGQDGGFWVFFQGSKMITIDPYEMRLRNTYDMKRWMKLYDPITAAHYDYQRSVYHLFFANNGYRTWSVNETFMNKLPMGWDRAFLHGTLSPLMKINQNFFGFDGRDLIDRDQPHFEVVTEHDDTSDRSPLSTTTSTTSTTTTTTTRRPRPVTKFTSPTTTTTESDVLYVTSRKNIFYNKNHRNRNGQLQQSENEDEVNGLEKDDSIGYQRQLMELQKEGVLDFSQDLSVNSSPTTHSNSLTGFTLILSSYCIYLMFFCV